MGFCEKVEKTRKTTSAKSEKSGFFDPFLTPFLDPPKPIHGRSKTLFFGVFDDNCIPTAYNRTPGHVRPPFPGTTCPAHI